MADNLEKEDEYIVYIYRARQIHVSYNFRYPVLSRAHQQLVVSLVEHEAQVIVSGARRSNVEFYLQYLYRIWKRRPYLGDDPMLSYARG